MRMFVALTPPIEALEHLAEFWEPRTQADAEMRWVDAEQWHLTLSFLASVPERALDGLEERLAAIENRLDQQDQALRHVLQRLIAFFERSAPVEDDAR